MKLNWNDIIINKNYKVINKITKGFTNDKYVIEVNQSKFILSKPKNQNYKINNYSNLYNIYKQIQSQITNVRICEFWNKNDTFVFKYIENVKDCSSRVVSIEKISELINEIQSLKIEAPKINWFKVANEYINVAKLNQFTFEEEILQLIEYNLQNLQSNINNNEVTVFAHGDLYADNLLYNQKNKEIYLIDFEFCCLTSPYWDIAYYAYYQNLNIKEISILLKTNKNNLNLNYFKHYFRLVNLVCICWSAYDYSLNKNEESLLQYKIGIKRLKKEI